LLEKMPAVFRSPVGKPKDGMTCYVGLVGKSAFFEGKRGNAIASITDGTSNTIMLVETDKQIPWTKPEDLPFDPDKELPKFGGLHESGFNACFCDGSVRFIQSDINKDTLKALITRDGGEVVPNDF
jgi:prepilin-type processing-associated H-X9-DG protein